MTILTRPSEKQLIVAFSGTKNPSELIEEIIEESPVSYKIHPNTGAKVFNFFYKHYLTDFRDYFLKEISEIFTTVDFEGYSVIFTGHSLGGALAVHAAADGILSGVMEDREVEVYTYGQPRVGNQEFIDLFISQISEFYRVVHHGDLVPHVPPCVPSFGQGCAETGWLMPIYPYHAPTEVYYNSDMDSYKICDQEDGEDQTCSNGSKHLSIDNHRKYFGIGVGGYYKIIGKEGKSILNYLKNYE